MKIVGIYNAEGVNSKAWLEKLKVLLPDTTFEIIDSNNYLATNFGINRFPTILVLNNANIIRDKLQGKYPVKDTVDWLTNLL